MNLPNKKYKQELEMSLNDKVTDENIDQLSDADLREKNSKRKLFADDTSMYLSLNDDLARTLTLNSDMEKIQTWASTWKVTFNALKTDKLNICNQNTVLTNSLYFDNTLIKTRASTINTKALFSKATANGTNTLQT